MISAIGKQYTLKRAKLFIYLLSLNLHEFRKVTF